MPRPEVPDTGVFIRLAHTGAGATSFLDRFAGGDVFLSAVVLAEFLAGTRSAEDAQIMNNVARVAERTGKLLTPSADDWQLAGRLLARRVRAHGLLRPRDHLNDLLILVSAARVRGVVTTANVQHFATWLPFVRRARLDVLVRPAGSP